jgi:hypothetical protein
MALAMLGAGFVSSTTDVFADVFRAQVRDLVLGPLNALGPARARDQGCFQKLFPVISEGEAARQRIAGAILQSQPHQLDKLSAKEQTECRVSTDRIHEFADSAFYSISVSCRSRVAKILRTLSSVEERHTAGPTVHT